MQLTINTFPDLLHIVNTHPEWRHKLVKALFPEVNLPKALQELARSGQRMEAMIKRMDENDARMTQLYGQLDTRVSHLETDVGILKTDVAILKTDVGILKSDVGILKSDVGVLKTDVGTLKGKSHERDYRDKAAGIFGRYMRRGHNVTNEVADQLDAAEEAGTISSQEFVQVLAADLLWGGQLRKAEGEVVLVLEASWLAELTDVERAVARANILRKIGLAALPVVAGNEWTAEAEEAARAQGVVMTTNGHVDNGSWEQAWKNK